jgi:hypothetical protein
MAVLAVVVGVVCPALAVAAPVGLDASYGSGGLVQLVPPLPSGLHPVRYPLIKAVFARGGSAYATEAVSTCEFDYSVGSCQHGIRLFHYGKNGAVDSAFGNSGSVAFPYQTELIAADAGGRVLVAIRTKTGGRVERLLPSGRPDKSFGRGGSVGLKGFKGLIGFLAPAGRGRILVGVSEDLPEASEAPARRLTLFRLLPNGRLDRSFARDGRGSYALALSYLETRFAIDRRGSILILGGLCCEGFQPVYRISPKGKLDSRTPVERCSGSTPSPDPNRRRSYRDPTAASTSSGPRGASTSIRRPRRGSSCGCGPMAGSKSGSENGERGACRCRSPPPAPASVTARSQSPKSKKP